MIWLGTTKSRGLILACRLPTAEKAMMVRTPRERRAAMLARAGTSWGARWWCGPWRARKAIEVDVPGWVCEGWESTVTGEEGEPQGVERVRDATGLKFGSDEMPVPPIMAMRIGELNPTTAARLVQPLGTWRRYDPARQALMGEQLERVLAVPNLSKNTYEMVSKSIA
jgi:hypothetical protein